MATLSAPAPRAYTKATLAAELGLTWKTIAKKCAAARIDVPATGSVLTAAVVRAVRSLFVPE